MNTRIPCQMAHFCNIARPRSTHFLSILPCRRELKPVSSSMGRTIRKSGRRLAKATIPHEKQEDIQGCAAERSVAEEETERTAVRSEAGLSHTLRHREYIGRLVCRSCGYQSRSGTGLSVVGGRVREASRFRVRAQKLRARTTGCASCKNLLVAAQGSQVAESSFCDAPHIHWTISFQRAASQLWLLLVTVSIPPHRDAAWMGLRGRPAGLVSRHGRQCRACVCYRALTNVPIRRRCCSGEDIFLIIVLSIIGGVVYLTKAPAIQQGLAEASDNLKVSAAGKARAESQRQMSDLGAGLIALGIPSYLNTSSRRKVSLWTLQGCPSRRIEELQRGKSTW